MRKLIFIVTVALLPGMAVAAEQQKKKPAPLPSAANPCAQYGAGWVQVKGSSTCVKVGGSISIDVGR
jgi:hypothetical protein